ELAKSLHAHGGRRRAGGRIGAAGTERRLWLALLLLQLDPAETRPRSRVRRRRWKGDRAMRAEASPDRSVPGPLGAERSRALRGTAVPDRLSRRRVHRLPRFVESRA